MFGRRGEGGCFTGTSLSEVFEVVLERVNHFGGPRRRAPNTEGEFERGEGCDADWEGFRARSSVDGEVNCRFFMLGMPGAIDAFDGTVAMGSAHRSARRSARKASDL